MITIVRHKAIDCVRANALRERLTAHDQYEATRALLDPAAGPCEMVERGQRRRQIDDGLSRLGIGSRQAIELAFFEELTHDEVAVRMIIPLGTVKTWIRRGCQQIRREMERPIARHGAGHPVAG
jgi:RNA polymerase sigma-70 factor (ECF subfamily)